MIWKYRFNKRATNFITPAEPTESGGFFVESLMRDTWVQFLIISGGFLIHLEVSRGTLELTRISRFRRPNVASLQCPHNKQLLIHFPTSQKRWINFTLRNLLHILLTLVKIDDCTLNLSIIEKQCKTKYGNSIYAKLAHKNTKSIDTNIAKTTRNTGSTTSN